MEIAKNVLKNVLTEAVKFIEKKDRSAITSHFFFEAVSDSELILRATDAEIGYQVSLAVDGAISFDCNGIDLLAIVKGSKKAAIIFEIVDNSVIIQTESKNTLKMYDIEESDLTFFEDMDSEEMQKVDSSFEVDKILFDSIDSNNPKFELNGLLVDFKNGYLAATNTRVLTYKKFEPVPGLDNIIIPKKALRAGMLLDDLLLKYRNYETFSVAERAIFSSGDSKIYSKLIEGKWPEYQRIIPKASNMLQIKVDGAEMLDFIKKQKGNGFAMRFKDNNLRIEALTSDDTSAMIDIKCDYPNPNTLWINLGYETLIIALSAGEITLGVNDSQSPITVSNGEIDTVVMPIVFDDSISSKPVNDFYASTWEYKPKQVQKKRVNKDAIIAGLNAEILSLKRELAKYENQKSVVKSEIFCKIFDSARKSEVSL